MSAIGTRSIAPYCATFENPLGASEGQCREPWPPSILLTGLFFALVNIFSLIEAYWTKTGWNPTSSNLLLPRRLGTIAVPMATPTIEQMAMWPAPNYIDPKTLVIPLIVTLVLGLAIMLPFVMGRIYIRLKLKRGFAVDDWIIFAAAVR
jgi:hypothetical protein